MASELEVWESFKAKLETEASCHISAIAAKCQVLEILDEKVLKAITQSKDSVKGAKVLLEAVENAIKRDPNTYDAFIAILEEILTGDGATLASEVKKELRIRRNLEQCSYHTRVKSKPSNKTLAATKVGSEEGDNRAGNKSMDNNGASKSSKRPARVSGSGGDTYYAYVVNPAPRRQQLDLDDARKVLIQSPAAMLDMDAFQELQQKCDQLENDCSEKALIEKELSKRCEVLKGLVEEKDRELDAMKTRLSGIESLKHNVSSEYTALQKRMAEYECRIEAEVNAKNELTKKLKQKALIIEQGNNDIKRLMVEIKQLMQQNKCLIKENCELKEAQKRVTELGVLVVLVLFALMLVAILAVGAYTFSCGSYSGKRPREGL